MSHKDISPGNDHKYHMEAIKSELGRISRVMESMYERVEQLEANTSASIGNRGKTSKPEFYGDQSEEDGYCDGPTSP